MKQRLIIILAFLFLCCSLIASQISLARSPQPPTRPESYECGYGSYIDITPEAPTPSDTITLTSSGIWPYTCHPLYQSHEVTSHIIRINAAHYLPPNSICGAALTRWAFSISMTNLLTGFYQADLYITHNEPTQTTDHCASKQFSVSFLAHRVYLPIVTK
jgi:hypothetical protein